MLSADLEFNNENETDNNLQKNSLGVSNSRPTLSPSNSSQFQNTSDSPSDETKEKNTRAVLNDATLQKQMEENSVKLNVETFDQSESKNVKAEKDTVNYNLKSGDSTTELAVASQKSSSAQTKFDDFRKVDDHSNSNGKASDLEIPLSVITLNSILLSARAKAETEISPKQFGVYQLSKNIILLFQKSLQSERDAYEFIGLPIQDVLGHPIDRIAWWFWIIHKSVEDLNPPPGYILPALKMLRQEIASLADGAVEIINVQKTIHKQLRRMAGILNNVFTRYEDIFGVREWEPTLRKNRSEGTEKIHEKYEKWLKTSESPLPECIKLTCFDAKSILLQHTTNDDYPPTSLKKVDLRRQKEFIKACLHHVNSLLRRSCVNSLKAHEDLSKTENEIQENIDKLVKKIENLRRVYRFRETTCAVLLKKSLSSLGLCLYEFIDMVIFIRKLGRFVLLASQHVLRYANSWSHLCDVTCLNQLDSVFTEFSEGEAFVLFRCFENWSGKGSKFRTREKFMSAFAEYFHQWHTSNVYSIVQVQLPMNLQATNIIFGKDDKTPSIKLKHGIVCKKSESVMAGKKKSRISIPDIYSTKEIDITFISKGKRPIPVPTESESYANIDTIQRLENIGLKLNKEQVLTFGELSINRNSKGTKSKSSKPSKRRFLSLTNVKGSRTSKVTTDQEHKPNVSTSLENMSA